MTTDLKVEMNILEHALEPYPSLCFSPVCIFKGAWENIHPEKQNTFWSKFWSTHLSRIQRLQPGHAHQNCSQGGSSYNIADNTHTHTHAHTHARQNWSGSTQGGVGPTQRNSCRIKDEMMVFFCGVINCQNRPLLFFLNSPLQPRICISK